MSEPRANTGSYWILADLRSLIIVSSSLVLRSFTTSPCHLSFFRIIDIVIRPSESRSSQILFTMSKESINAMMGRVVPELNSSYAAYPMANKAWVSASGKAPDGQPAFEASPKAPKGETKPLKKDYVWGPGTRGFGYYHMTTKEAYVILSARLQHEAGGSAHAGCCGRSKTSDETPRQEALKEIHHLMYFRSQSPVPNDKEARIHGLRQNAAAFRPDSDLGPWDIKPSKVRA